MPYYMIKVINISGLWIKQTFKRIFEILWLLVALILRRNVMQKSHLAIEKEQYKLYVSSYTDFQENICHTRLIHFSEKCSAASNIHTDCTFLTGRCAQVYFKGTAIGKLGVIHPDVLQAFDVHAPVSAIEISIEPFL